MCVSTRVGRQVTSRFPLPPCIVSQPVMRQDPGLPHQHQVGLYLGVAGLGLFDDVADGGLVEDLPDRHRRPGALRGSRMVEEKASVG
jgi:hypothetical protein